LHVHATPLARHKHNTPGTPYDEDLVGLRHHVQQTLKTPPVRD
jgi:hypothetical protein